MHSIQFSCNRDHCITSAMPLRYQSICLAAFVLLCVTSAANGNEAEAALGPIETHPNIQLINQENCGKNEYMFGYAEDRKPIIMQYPWMVQLRHPFQNPEYVPCNGLLINKNYVLTTNCVDWNDDVSVTLGDYRTDLTRDCEPRDQEPHFCLDPVQIIPVSEHTQKDQLALARLSVAAYIGRRNHIEAACLPTSPEQRDRIYPSYILTGWKESGKDAKFLQRAMLDLIPRQECQEEMDRYPYGDADEKNVTEAIVCVRNVADPSRSPRCNDYQPGTVVQVVEKTSNRYIAQGIQTGISYCSKPERFVRIAHYMQWILDTIKP
ncbi:chymotrypsin-like elastase family member 2A [Culex pipiens pallens]|uniref:chymotrypsin-like elastase family member 2A n=1 Tax=Culex pipiens pallens TaxID=42434 RepID=UPI001954499B|nr:chymotrypsin-like elastase family member 2A [Culex pipiens pallens]